MGGKGSGRARKLKDVDWKPDPKTEAWDRQEIDTDASWIGFTTYRDLGPGRTLAESVKTLGRKTNYITTLESWSRKHHWVKRVRAWDVHLDQIAQQERIAARRNAVHEMEERHLRISNHLQRLASVELMRWLNKIGANTENPDMRKPDLATKDIQALLDYSIKLERLNRNEPGEIIEQREGQMTHEEVEERIAHLLKIRE